MEPDGEHVIMRVSDPGEGGYITVTVRASKAQLGTMAAAQPLYSDGPPQTPTASAASVQGPICRHPDCTDPASPHISHGDH